MFYLLYFVALSAVMLYPILAHCVGSFSVLGVFLSFHKAHKLLTSAHVKNPLELAPTTYAASASVTGSDARGADGFTTFTP